MSYLLGIDLGTTYTAAAVQRLRGGEAAGEPEMVGLGAHGSEMPSVVLEGEDGSLLVGDAAERRATVEPDRVAREFKRRIGDPTPVSLGAGALPAQQLAAVVVRHVVETVTAREGGVPERIALTHPASWGGHKLDLLRAALEPALAGFGVPPVEFLAEPQAAAVCYAAAERVEPGSTIAVYDLGGGTFDAAVVRKEAAGGFTLLGRPEGVEFLGGVDFDEVVFEHVRAGAPEVFAGLDEADPAVWAAVARLRRECREAKEGLSADTEVSVPVWLGSAQAVVRLHRGEFEELIGPRIEDSVEALRRAVESAGLSASDSGSDPVSELSAVLLVGGSSRIPLVAQTVSERLGRPVAVDADPKNAIAKGAALAVLPRNVGRPGGRSASLPPPGAGPAGAAPASGTGAALAGAPLADSPGPLPWATADSSGGGAAVGGEPPTDLLNPAEPPTGLIPPGEPATAYVPSPHNPATAAWNQDPPTVVLPPVEGYGGDGYGNDGATTLAPAPETGRGRSPALLIGAGGVVAAVAVVGALVFWPDDQTVGNATPQLPAVPTATSAPPPTTESAPTSESQRETRERSAERPTSADPVPPQAPGPTAPPAQPTTSAPPPVTTTVPPTTTSSAPPPGPRPGG